MAEAIEGFQLPTDLAQHLVCTYVHDADSLMALGASCRFWRGVVGSIETWQSLLKHRYGKTYCSEPPAQVPGYVCYPGLTGPDPEQRIHLGGLSSLPPPGQCQAFSADLRGRVRLVADGQHHPLPAVRHWNPAPLKDPPEEEESSEEPEEGPLEEEDFYDSDAEDDEQREAHAQQLQQQQVARLRAREQREQRKALRKQAREEEERRELPVRQPAMYVREDLVEQHRLPLPPAGGAWQLQYLRLAKLSHALATDKESSVTWLNGEYLSRGQEQGSRSLRAVRLHSVCWLNLASSWPGVGPGRYTLLWRMRAPPGSLYLPTSLIVEARLVVARCALDGQPVVEDTAGAAAGEVEGGQQPKPAGERLLLRKLVPPEQLSRLQETAGPAGWFNLEVGTIEVPPGTFHAVSTVMLNHDTHSWKYGLVWDNVELRPVGRPGAGGQEAGASSAAAEHLGGHASGSGLAVQGLRMAMDSAGKVMQALRFFFQ